MKFIMRIESEGEQAQDEPGGLTYDLLRATADRIDEGDDEGKLFDVNGNLVGEWRIERWKTER